MEVNRFGDNELRLLAKTASEKTVLLMIVETFRTGGSLLIEPKGRTPMQAVCDKPVQFIGGDSAALFRDLAALNMAAEPGNGE